MSDAVTLPVAIEAYDGTQTSLEIFWLDPELVPEDPKKMWAILVIEDGQAWIDSYGYVSREEAEKLIAFRPPPSGDDRPV